MLMLILLLLIKLRSKTNLLVIQLQTRAIDDQAAEVQDVTPVVDLSSDMLDEAVEYDAVSPEMKRIKLVDSERIIMGEKLTDLEINLAQQLLKKQFKWVYVYTTKSAHLRRKQLETRCR